MRKRSHQSQTKEATHIQEQGSMSLDSLGTFSGIDENKSFADRKSNLSGKEECPDANWVFLFTHKMNLNKVNDKLSEKFETFVHKTIVYQRRGKKKTVKKERPTVSGLIFIHGAANDVKKFLSQFFPGLNPAKDYTTGRTAVISNREMSDFMKFASVGQNEVRFMLHPLDYYSEGHQRIRITSGNLKGCEGYIVRIHRDRKLITQIGNMTVAIGGITRESFENADEFVETLRNTTDKSKEQNELSPTELEIDRYFVTPANDLEAMAIAKNLEPLISKFQRKIFSEKSADIADSVVFTLSEIAGRFSPNYFKSDSVGIKDVCTALIKLLKSVIDHPTSAESLKEKISVDLESLMLRYPILPIDEIINPTD
ncbi:MAG: transcriptional regulator [Muribaculum sp.]|nr:transcriptional regulator [Muribaculum sp.]